MVCECDGDDDEEDFNIAVGYSLYEGGDGIRSVVGIHLRSAPECVQRSTEAAQLAPGKVEELEDLGLERVSQRSPFVSGDPGRRRVDRDVPERRVDFASLVGDSAVRDHVDDGEAADPVRPVRLAALVRVVEGRQPVVRVCVAPDQIDVGSHALVSGPALALVCPGEHAAERPADESSEDAAEHRRDGCPLIHHAPSIFVMLQVSEATTRARKARTRVVLS